MAIAGKDYDRLESLSELTKAIDMRLDLEFFLYGVRYNISTNEKPFICVCPDGNAVYYDNADDMVNHYKVDGKLLKDIWQDFEILAM